MKIITINLKKGIKVFNLLFKLSIFILIVALSINLSSDYFENGEEYKAVINELTEKKTIIIDAGHGGEDCGAIGTNGVYEKDLNLEIANILGEELKKLGYAVIYTRTTDRLLYTKSENIKGIRKISDLKNRCKIGAENENSIFISIHMNSFSDSKYSGLHTYYSTKNEDSYKLASLIQSKVKEKLQPENNRVIKPGKNMYLLENLSNIAILIECGFISNPDECERLCEKDYQKELCFSIICGIIEYIENK